MDWWVGRSVSAFNTLVSAVYELLDVGEDYPGISGLAGNMVAIILMFKFFGGVFVILINVYL